MYHVLVDQIPINETSTPTRDRHRVASIDLAGAEIAMSMQIGRERSLRRRWPPSSTTTTSSASTRRQPGPADGQRADRLRQGDRPGPVRISLDARSRPAPEHPGDDPREPEPDVKIEGILPTMLDSRTVHAKEAIEILEENFGKPWSSSRESERRSSSPRLRSGVERVEVRPQRGTPPTTTVSWRTRS